MRCSTLLRVQRASYAAQGRAKRSVFSVFEVKWSPIFIVQKISRISEKAIWSSKVEHGSTYSQENPEGTAGSRRLDAAHSGRKRR